MTALQRRPSAGAGDEPVRRRLVVIGNGMAGARAVEEILARGGAELFEITMFGDEPYGNYNRIMLSHVLSGEESHDDIYLNSLEWYVENDIVLHAGALPRNPNGKIDRNLLRQSMSLMQTPQTGS